MRRNFLKVLAFTFISTLFLPINFLSAATKKLLNKKLTDEVIDIIGSDDILGSYYLVYPPNMSAKAHIDYNPYNQKYLRIQIPIKIPNNNSNNECYIEWIECDQRIYWKEGESMTFDVEKLHQGSNQSDQSMEFLYIDVNPEVELE